jgi:hypothetical protein
LVSKYTAILLLPGLLLWLLWVPGLRPWLLRPAPWLALVLAALVFLPVILWNADHGWASFLKQGGRVQDWRPMMAVRFLADLIGGQIGLATPLVFAFCVGGGALAAARAWRGRDPGWTLLACLTLPGVVLFLQHALGDRVQGNWPAILYPSAAIAAAGLDGRRWLALRRPAVVLGLAISAVVYLQAVASPIPLPLRLDTTALRLAGWSDVARQVEAAARTNGAEAVAVDDYGLASELAFALPGSIPVLVLDRRWQYFDLPRRDVAGMRLLLLGYGFDPRRFVGVEDLGKVTRARDGAVIDRFLLRLATGKEFQEAVVLPGH